MKRSELKEAIKAEITSVLSENVNPAFDKEIASFAKKINNEMGYQGGVLEAMKQIKSRLESIISKVEDAKRGGAEEEPLIKMIGLKEDDTEDDKKAVKGTKSKEAKGLASVASQVEKLKNKLQDNKSEMLKIAKIPRNERTNAQQDLIDNMADITKELKKLRQVKV